jgi:MFS transporter, SP family, xylose:H+ symportor
MKNKVLQYALIASLTGFLFGFDSVVISGVNLPLKHLWKTSDWFHGTFIISISLWGMVVGSLLGGYPAERLGRKKTLIWVGTMFTISAVGAALSVNPVMFSFFRFIGGLSAGVGSIAAPAYMSEIATANNRGRLGMLFQLNIVTGILTAFLSNYFLIGVGGANDWRWMLGVMAFPAALYTLMLLTIKESPRWLQNTLVPQGEERLFSGKYNKVLMLSLLIAFFNQFSGVSFILFYAPEIMEKAGWGTAQSLLSSVFIGLVNVVFTVVGMYLIDRIGRRQLMYIGSMGYIISLSMVAFCFYQGLPAGFTLLFILLYVVSHAVGQGAVIWVFITEIFPTRVRSFGQSWGSGLLNSFAAVVTSFGAVVISTFSPWIIFAGFALLMVGQLLFTHFMMPETKGVSLEELEKKLT